MERKVIFDPRNCPISFLLFSAGKLGRQRPPQVEDSNQLVKGFRLIIQGAILLVKENKELRAANEKQKQNCTRSRRQIPAEEGLSVQEASQLITTPVEAPGQMRYLPHEKALRRLYSHVRGPRQSAVVVDK